MMSAPTANAAVFMSGNSQAIRLPKSFRLNASRVTLRRVGNDIVISEKLTTMKQFLDQLPHIPDAPLAPDDGPEEPVQAW
jgi:antitoxin VapB